MLGDFSALIATYGQICPPSNQATIICLYFTKNRKFAGHLNVSKTLEPLESLRALLNLQCAAVQNLIPIKLRLNLCFHSYSRSSFIFIHRTSSRTAHSQQPLWERGNLYLNNLYLPARFSHSLLFSTDESPESSPFKSPNLPNSMSPPTLNTVNIHDGFITECPCDIRG